MRLARLVSALLSLALMWAMLGACVLHRRHTDPIPPGCMVTPCGDMCCNDDGVPCPPCWVGIRTNQRVKP